MEACSDACAYDCRQTNHFGNIGGDSDSRWRKREREIISVYGICQCEIGHIFQDQVHKDDVLDIETILIEESYYKTHEGDIQISSWKHSSTALSIDEDVDVIVSVA